MNIEHFVTHLLIKYGEATFNRIIWRGSVQPYHMDRQRSTVSCMWKCPKQLRNYMFVSMHNILLAFQDVSIDMVLIVLLIIYFNKLIFGSSTQAQPIQFGWQPQRCLLGFLIGLFHNFNIEIARRWLLNWMLHDEAQSKVWREQMLLSKTGTTTIGLRWSKAG